MSVLIFGPSGSGKTHVASAWKKKGLPAFEDSDIAGLSGWYNREGKRVDTPTTANEALRNRHSFLWSKRVLKNFLVAHPDAYVFGGSGNLFDMTPLFEKVFFLKVEPSVQKDRIRRLPRATPLMDFDEAGIVIWGDWLEEEAKKRSIPFLDATLSPEQLLEEISRR